MEIDWGANAHSLANALIWILIWIGAWDLVELVIETTVDHQKHYIRNKFIIYTCILTVGVLFALVFGSES